MRLNRSLYRFAGQLALFAMLAAALMPTISRALAVVGVGPALALELCSIDGGVYRVSLPLPSQGPPDAPSPAQAHLDACGYCVLQAGGEAPLAPSAAMSIAGAPSTTVPALFLRAPRPLFAWTAASPRGPPAFSV